MSGLTDGAPAEVPVPDCGAGYYPKWNAQTQQYDCIKGINPKPFEMIWQGDCEGWLVIRLSYAPAINPSRPVGTPVPILSGPDTAPLARRGRRVAGPEVQVEQLAKRVSTAALKRALRALKGSVRSVKGKTAAPKQRSRKKAKAPSRSRAPRRKK
jgi:hypothetical protein